MTGRDGKPDATVFTMIIVLKHPPLEYHPHIVSQAGSMPLVLRWVFSARLWMP